MPSSGSSVSKRSRGESNAPAAPETRLAVTPDSQGSMQLFESDPRLAKREVKEKQKNSSLVWRRGSYSASEIAALETAVHGWISERGLSRAEGYGQLLWGRDNNLNRVWCDIGQRSGLFLRSLENLRKAAIRHVIRDKRPWTREEKARLVELQATHGPHSWKLIAKELGRSLEETRDQGLLIESGAAHRKVRSEMKTRSKQIIPVFPDAEGEKFTETERQILLALRSQPEYRDAFPVHNIIWIPIAAALNFDTEARRRLAIVYGDLLTKCRKAVDKEHPMLIERAILYRLYLGVEGRLDNLWVFADMDAVDWTAVCPFLPVKDAKAIAIAQLRMQTPGILWHFVTAVRQTKTCLDLNDSDEQGGIKVAGLMQAMLRRLCDFVEPAAVLDE